MLEKHQKDLAGLNESIPQLENLLNKPFEKDHAYSNLKLNSGVWKADRRNDKGEATKADGLSVAHANEAAPEVSASS